MKKTISALVLAACLSAVAIPAYAYDYNSEVRSDWNDIRRDRGQIDTDARKVDQERDELASARRHERWAWWRGNFWGARRAAEHAQEERAELWAARNKLNHDGARNLSTPPNLVLTQAACDRV